MDYQTIDLLMRGATLILSLSGNIGVIVVWFGNKGRATQAAIDRVETHAREQHQEQEARIIRLESSVQHALTAEQLNRTLLPVFKGIKDLGELVTALKGDITARPTQGQLNAEIGKVYERVNTVDNGVQIELRGITRDLGKIDGKLQLLAPSLALVNQELLRMNNNNG